MRRHLLAATALTVVLAGVPAPAAAFAVQDPAEERDGGSNDSDEVRDRRPAANDGPNTGEEPLPAKLAECREPAVSRSYTAEAMV